MMNKISMLTTAIIASGISVSAQGAIWSSTELHLQLGELTDPFTGDDVDTTILTFQHASGWQYGENFFFIDHINTDGGQDYYGEWYPFFSSKKIMGMEYGGPIRDIGFVMGFNAAGDANVMKYLPGIQINWDIPGFAFINTLLSAYIDDSEGVASGGAPKEDDSFMLDVAWKYPFDIGNASFSIEGHAEYIDGRKNEFDGDVESWILAQPQFRWDAGKTLFGEAGQLHVGIEYQYWQNKLGVDEDESAVQLLVVWGL